MVASPGQRSSRPDLVRRWGTLEENFSALDELIATEERVARLRERANDARSRRSRLFPDYVRPRLSHFDGGGAGARWRARRDAERDIRISRASEATVQGVGSGVDECHRTPDLAVAQRAEPARSCGGVGFDPRADRLDDEDVGKAHHRRFAARPQLPWPWLLSASQGRGSRQAAFLDPG
jgi:hypothetical protein